MTLFQTQNRALAVTLATCGVPFAKGEDGQPSAYIHIYDADILRKLGYKGWSLQDAARDAWKNGKRGILVYNFERNELCERILKTYDNHSKAIASGRGEFTIDIEPEQAAQICCQYAKNRNTLSESWRNEAPCIAIHGAQHSESSNGKTTIIGSFKVMSLNATPETRAKLKL